MMEQYLGEFFGTLFLIILGDGVVAGTLLKKSKGYQGGWIAITTGWFIAVMIGVFVAQSVGSPNADINPAISFAKFFMHQYNLTQAALFSLCQIAGAFLGAIIVWLAYFPHWKETEDHDHKLMVFCTKPAILAYPYNFLCEVIGTTVLMFGVFAIFSKAIITGSTSGIGPYLVGVLVWGIGLSLGGPTGYAINPARDLGPRIAHTILPLYGKGSSEWHYAGIPIVGPILGAIIAVCIWQWLQ